ncbi:MAG: hypothetical protein AAB967_02370, partial [Patescibacteria group bacterium]
MPRFKKAIMWGGEKKFPLAKGKNFRISKFKNETALTWLGAARGRKTLVIASSRALSRWRMRGALREIREAAVFVPPFSTRGLSALYFGENAIRVAYSKDLTLWSIAKRAVLEPRNGFFDDAPLEAAGVLASGDGTALFYYVKKTSGQHTRYSIGAALFDARNPEKLLMRLDAPLWEQGEDLADKDLTPLGMIELRGVISFYFQSREGTVFAVSHASFHELLRTRGGESRPRLRKSPENPLLEPKAEHIWESRATFNPAALFEEGKVHLLYRAIGDHDVSVLGYASSRDGVHIDERLALPAYVPHRTFEGARPRPEGQTEFISPYMSGGGGYGGCEDPRLTRIGERVYMTYVAYNGWSEPRVALTSIALRDFLEKRWNWKEPVLISPPGIIDKNACILPEKVNGKYVIFHRVFPHIQVDFVDDLNFDGKTKWLKPK